MKIFLDNENRIISVRTAVRKDLMELEIDENDAMYPFKGWSDARICCYKISYVTDIEVQNKNEDTESTIEKHRIITITPYVSDCIIEKLEDIDSREKFIEKSVYETQDALCEQSTTTEQSVSDIENAMCESELSYDERLAAIEDALCELSMQ